MMDRSPQRRKGGGTMKGIQPVCRRQEGYALLYVVCFLFLAVGLVAAILPLSSNHRKIAQRQVDMERAMYVAEAGLERSARYLDSNIATIAAVTITNGSIGQGSYSSMIKQLNWYTFSIICTGTVNNVSRVVRLDHVSQPTYAEFSLWSSNNGVVWFAPGDVFNGHVHANDALYFMNPGGTSGPTFHDACDSFANYYYSKTGSSQVKNGSLAGVTFDKGFQLNAYEGRMADVDFKSVSAQSLLNDAINNSGLVLQGTSTLTFNGGTLSINNSRHTPTSFSYTPNSNGIIYVQTVTSGTTSTRAGRAYLAGGDVTGKLTIVTEESMYVRGHILYTNDPRIDPTSTDALGLIAGGDVVVDTTAPNNLEIDAVMMATGLLAGSGSFGVKNYDSGSPRGTLTLYGGIVQKVRGAVGTLDANGQTATGYSKRYSFDPRFIDNPPPYYPAIKNKLQWSGWHEGPY